MAFLSMIRANACRIAVLLMNTALLDTENFQIIDLKEIIALHWDTDAIFSKLERFRRP